MTNVVAFRPDVDVNTSSSYGLGEATACRAIRLCKATLWSPATKAKAGLTAESMRAELARILFVIQQLKRASGKGDVMAMLELLAFKMTLDIFETEEALKAIDNPSL